ncbi:MAG: hypothetical protein D6717_06435 [Gammaproteobacteria bacterium]|nr:MAG: hypothetical protein D6717_06435 [Gammaproteobacteria bacterium]
MQAQVQAIGFCAPGLADWSAAQNLLAGPGDWAEQGELHKLAPALLPANERRRTTVLIRMALQAAQEAAGEAGGPLPAVFASSGGDLEIVDRILQALQMPGRPVSPTHFHNSVHNAPAGYWSIARKDHAPSTSVSAHDASLATGLLEALTWLAGGVSEVLLVAYDHPAPPTLAPFRPLLAPFAVALRLTAGGEGPGLSVQVDRGRESTLDRPSLEALRQGNPAARSLPLLERLARESSGTVYLPMPAGQLRVEVAP